MSTPASAPLAVLMGLMRTESTGDKASGFAILNALFSALFALVLRAASEFGQAPEGLLALAGHARPGLSYFRAKIVQEALIEASGVPYTIVRATQFFEFLAGIADAHTVEDTVRLPLALLGR